MIKILFITGLVTCGVAAGSLFMGEIESGVAALVGIVGMGLMGSSSMRWSPAQEITESNEE